MSRVHRAATMSGSIRSHRPPARPNPMRGMCTEADRLVAWSATAVKQRSTASYLIGGPLLPVRMPRWATMFATQMSSWTWISCVTPRPKSLFDRSRCHPPDRRALARPRTRDRQDEALAPPAEIVTHMSDDLRTLGLRTGRVTLDDPQRYHRAMLPSAAPPVEYLAVRLLRRADYGAVKSKVR